MGDPSVLAAAVTNTWSTVSHLAQACDDAEATSLLIDAMGMLEEAVTRLNEVGHA